MEEEIFNIYDKEGNHLGIAPKSECHKRGVNFYHKPVWIWIINNDGNVLIQKRSKNKKVSGGLFDVSCGGHVKFDETIIEGAMRELYEELGLKINKSQYKFLGEYRCDETMEIAQVYIIKITSDIKDFILQKEEVEEIKWVNLNELEILFNKEEFVSYNIDYQNWILNILRKYKD